MGAIQTTYTTAPAVGFAGMKADNKAERVSTGKNCESSASMPFGAIVAYKTSSPTSDHDMILPAATSAKLAGLVRHSHDYEREFTLADGSVAGELDATGLNPNAEFALVEAGCYWVTCEDGCVPGDRLFVRISGGTLGAARSTDATGGTCIDATNCGKWLSTATAGNPAKLQFDFLAKTTAGA
jgi:hypothetical protein